MIIMKNINAETIKQYIDGKEALIAQLKIDNEKYAKACTYAGLYGGMVVGILSMMFWHWLGLL